MPPLDDKRGAAGDELVIDGNTLVIPHIGYPTASFKAPLIYNPWFAKRGINAVVVPMAVTGDDYAQVLPALLRLRNFRGALVTMPHKVTTVAMLDEASTMVKIAGSCNALLKRPDGTLAGDMFDGVGFTRALARRGFRTRGARCLVVGTGGVGCAIVASLAAEGAGSIALFDTDAVAAEGLAERVRIHHPGVEIGLAPRDPAGYDLVVNATPLGMKVGDPLPFDPARLAASTFVGEVVMKEEITPLLAAARERGCRYLVGTDMLYEMIPAYLEFFGFGTATPEELRAVSKVPHAAPAEAGA